MKTKALFSSKDKSEKLKCRLLQFLFGPLVEKLTKYLLSAISIAITTEVTGKSLQAPTMILLLALNKYYAKISCLV